MSREERYTDEFNDPEKVNQELEKALKYQHLITEELHDSETLLNLIIENVSSGVAVIDDSGKFIIYNKEFLRLFGLSENSTILNVNDQNWSKWQVFNENQEILHVDDHPVRKAALTGRKIRNQLVGVKLPSGQDLKWMLISAEPIFKANGNTEKIICTYKDITEQRIIDFALRKSEDRLRLALEAADLGTWDWDLESGKVYHSLRHDQIFGYEELQSEWSVDIALNHVFPEDRAIFQHGNEKARITGEMLMDFRIVRTDGSIHWINSRGRTHYDRKGKPVRIIGVVADITERKTTERALEENEKQLRELVATKDKLFSIIAHDLKSPFTSIIGFSDMLIEKIQRKAYDDIEEYATIIQKSSWRAMDLLTNLFDWSRLQTGKMNFNPGTFDIVKTIKEVISLYNDTALHKSISISSYIPESFNVNADEPMIGTVLRNLLSNAIKFTNPGGHINISAFQSDSEYIVEITDDGIGMNSSVIEKLFINGSYSIKGTNGEEGTGLGLILCKEFILKHNGRIWAESEPGKGSKFTFTLPA